jgi:DNA polymerase III subunit epsilon
MSTRQIVLDTETTGLEPSKGHKIIEIGCVELIDRRFTGNNFHVYINPGRDIEAGALAVHGITLEFLADKPTFIEIRDEFLKYIIDAELIIHNAPFDVGFLNHELRAAKKSTKLLTEYVLILDTLALARKRFPGQKNSLDALCKRFKIDNSKRDFHGALLDARLLAEVYLAMTGGQISLLAEDNWDDDTEVKKQESKKREVTSRNLLPIIHASEEELALHHRYLELLRKKAGSCLWDEKNNE